MMTVAILSPTILAFLFYSDIRTDCGNWFEFSAALLRELHILQTLYTNSIIIDSAGGLLQWGLLRDRFLDSLHLFQLKMCTIFRKLDLFPSSDERARRKVSICWREPNIHSSKSLDLDSIGYVRDLKESIPDPKVNYSV